MQVTELNKAQLHSLKEAMLCERQESVSYDELAAADELISDEEVIEQYGATDFTGDDFFGKREIYFRAGYHEWVLWIDNESAWSTEDPAESLEAYGLDDLVDLLVEDAAEKLDLSGEEKEDLKQQMKAQWYSHYIAA